MAVDILLFDGKGKHLGFEGIYTTEVIVGKTNEELRKKIRKSSHPVIVLGDPRLNRFILTSQKVDLLLDPHTGAGGDFLNQRNSGLNQVLAKMAHDNHTAIGFSFSNLLHSQERITAMGRIMQNIKLCRKYKVKMVFASFAKNEMEQRSVQDLKSLARCLGMNPLETKDSFKHAETLFRRQPK